VLYQFLGRSINFLLYDSKKLSRKESSSSLSISFWYINEQAQHEAQQNKTRHKEQDQTKTKGQRHKRERHIKRQVHDNKAREDKTIDKTVDKTRHYVTTQTREHSTSLHTTMADSVFTRS
jgi:hypothetical protein